MPWHRHYADSAVRAILELADVKNCWLRCWYPIDQCGKSDNDCGSILRQCQNAMHIASDIQRERTADRKWKYEYRYFLRRRGCAVYGMTNMNRIILVFYMGIRDEFDTSKTEWAICIEA